MSIKVIISFLMTVLLVLVGVQFTFRYNIEIPNKLFRWYNAPEPNGIMQTYKKLNVRPTHDTRKKREQK